MNRLGNVLVALGAGLLLLVAPLMVGAATGKKVSDTKIVLIAGPRSHSYGSHEFNAGCMLLSDCLQQAMPTLQTVVCKNGWPADGAVLEDADTIVLFADGGGGNPIMPHLEQMDRLMKKGVGFVCLHYAVQVPKGKSGEYFKSWLGGYYETYWSVNPHWNAQFKSLPEHPTTRGVHPFQIEDEWYYHMRFRDGMQGVTPILSAIPPDATRRRPDGPHSGNPAVRARMGMPETLAWACQRSDGGRAFGFTGGHWQWNWASNDFRTLVLNAIIWTSGLDVPAQGVVTRTPTLEQLQANLDEPKPKNFDAQAWLAKIKEWNTPAKR